MIREPPHMSNWDLMMPGMGLTAIGLAGVTVSYAGIAHTFIDGMHALTGLTMFIGLIFLATGILDGGVSTSNRAKATVLVIAAISLSFGTAALMFNTISTIPLFASLMIILAIPAIVISYVATKMPEYTRPIGLIFVLAAVAGVSAYVAFGLVGPDTYLIDEPVIEEVEEPALDPSVPVLAVSILAGSDQQGNPDYEPDAAVVPAGSAVEWSNDDVAAHTVTSKPGGEAFDSSLMSAGDTFALGPGSLDAGTYEYFCIVHPWMEATVQIE